VRQRGGVDEADVIRIGRGIIQRIEQRAGERTVLPRVVFERDLASARGCQHGHIGKGKRASTRSRTLLALSPNGAATRLFVCEPLAAELG
jgi:hypothetical protein